MEPIYVNPPRSRGAVGPSRDLAFVRVKKAPLDWNVIGVPLPQHLYRFDLHSDYVDRGAVGGINLIEGGTGNTFLNGLVINADGGYAYSAPNPDVNNLGAVFSILVKMKPNGVGFGAILNCIPNNWEVFAGVQINHQGDSAPLYLAIVKDGENYITKSTATPVNNGDDYVIIITFNAGALKVFINGIEETLVDDESIGTVDSVPDTENGMFVGEFFDAPNSPMGDGTVFEVVAIHKGKEYSQAEVTAIQAGLA